jgi:putative glutamine amidotransferase
MSSSTLPLHIGIYGLDKSANSKRPGFGLWSAGFAASVAAAGGTPQTLELPRRGAGWEDVLEGIHGVVFAGGFPGGPSRAAAEAGLCETCRELKIPFLGVDQGLHALNAAFGGNLYLDLPRELPLALQHRHPPEKGVRHAILVERNTRLADLYGEGEVVVNSEHCHAINRVARGFLVSARALDGVVEAIEADDDVWYALGVQWNPASVTASGLDIQVFRGLADAARLRLVETADSVCSAAA